MGFISNGSYVHFYIIEFFCTRPPTVPNAKHNTSLIRQQHGTVVEYKCDGGYRLEGEAILTCETTTWRGSPPRCIALPGKDLPTEREEEEAMSDPITSKGGLSRNPSSTYPICHRGQRVKPIKSYVAIFRLVSIVLILKG